MGSKSKAPKVAGKFGDRQQAEGAIGNVNSDTRSGEEAARIERAAEIAHDADEWVAEHPDAWAYIVDLCIVEAENERTVSMQWACEQVRKLDFASFPTPYAYVNNKIRPALARRLVREHPECAPFIELRRSILDLVDEEAVDGM